MLGRNVVKPESNFYGVPTRKNSPPKDNLPISSQFSRSVVSNSWRPYGPQHIHHQLPEPAQTHIGRALGPLQMLVRLCAAHSRGTCAMMRMKLRGLCVVVAREIIYRQQEPAGTATGGRTPKNFILLF